MLETTPLIKSQKQERRPLVAAFILLVCLGISITYTGSSFTAWSFQSVHQSKEVFCDSAKQESGYIKLPHKLDDHYFYWFFESQASPENDPVVIWLEGGPGTSSIWSLLNENGPCRVGDDANSTIPNPYSWTKNANVIWLDQPTGVGFSYGTSRDDDHNEVDVGRNIYEFLQEWLKKHPRFQSNDVFISGQSYGGHYVPAAASYIVRMQEEGAESAIPIHLKGITIGNGLTDTVVQYPMLVEMAVENSYNITLVSPEELIQMQKDARVLEEMVKLCQQPDQTQDCMDTDEFWDEKLLEPMITNPARNMYDIRELCDPDCDDLGGPKTTQFLNKEWVQARLHVKKQFEWSNDHVMDDFAVDEEKNAVKYVAYVLEHGIRVLVYAGDADLVCDWKGNDAWTRKLEWSGHREFNSAPMKPFKVEGSHAGDVRSARGLSFVRIFNSGHCVPRDQPVVALNLVNRFFQDQTL